MTPASNAAVKSRDPDVRTASLRSTHASGNLLRQPAVGSARSFNTALDRVFYDVGALAPAEVEWLTQHVTPEGRILLVPPHGDGALAAFTPIEFIDAQRALLRTDCVVVPGVGSSALGAAALARDVANHLGRPVAAIVAGFGMADLLSEALGGWFVLGARNAARDTIARLFDALDVRDHVRDQASHADIKARLGEANLEHSRFIYGSPDSTALLQVLLALGTRVRLLVGHSKGNYSIENALEGWVATAEATGGRVNADLRVVTLGAVVRFPDAFRAVSQVIGGEDLFGMINSRPLVPHTLLPGAWHSLNHDLPGAMSVAGALAAAAIPPKWAA